MPIKANGIPVGRASDPPRTLERVFLSTGENEYRLDVLPIGICIAVSRLKRSHSETVGELSVSVNGSFPNAKSYGGVLSRGNFNFSSFQTRSTLSKLLVERSGNADLDWHGFLDEFAHRVLDAERKGSPSVILADEPDTEESNDVWLIDDWPVLQDLPMVLFGKGGAGKSYFAMWIAGRLADQGIPVLYADWEFSRRQHRRRLGRLFQPLPRNLHYLTCDKPLPDEAERILDTIKQHKIQYMVCDSIVFALGGKALDDDQAGIYYRTLRRFKIGTLNIAHTTKADDDAEKQIFGSVFFANGSRSTWFIERANENPQGTIQFGLFHKKSNGGEILKPRAYRLVFERDRTRLEKLTVDSVDELAAKLPILDRMKRALQRGSLTVKGLSDATDSSTGVIRKMVSRHPSVFVRMGNMVGLLVTTGKDGLEF